MPEAEFLLTDEEIDDIALSLPENACPEKITEIFDLIFRIYGIPTHVAFAISIEILQKLYNVLPCEGEGETIH